MDSVDLRLLRLAQEGVRLTERPYRAWGECLGISEEETMRRLADLEKEGVIRRFAATIGHRALGIAANAMIVWRVPAAEVERVGRLFASSEAVTHAYERTTAPDWPYNLYTMVHSRERDHCIQIASQLSSASGIEDYRILFSEKEYKKTSARI